ncbi:PfkB family carbohydrate kinase [Aliiruegeria haliotis]|uniref:PfkB family carbohydrate kinase n=1 Tax=Aliiruegeria haliotis TaxID=1280846 RepID=UPI000D04DE7D
MDSLTRLVAKEPTSAPLRHGVGAIVTLGVTGLAWATGESSGSCAAPVVTAVDTVAGPNCLNGGIAAELSRRASLEHAVEFAPRAAALSATRPGAVASLPT